MAQPNYDQLLNNASDAYSVMAGIGSDAANIRTGDNPAYILADFYAMYPQYALSGDPATQPVAEAVLQMFINLANASIKEARWRDAWKIAMGLFVAHFATLWLQGTAGAGSPAKAVMQAGQARGLYTGKSVGDVSASIDYSAIANDLDGWAAWKLTIYGQQLATLGKLVGKGGMYVW